MYLDSATIVVSAICWFTLTPTSLAFSFYCGAHLTCKIRNWNPALEGTFVLHHIPKAYETLELINFLTSSTTSKLFDEFTVPRQDIATFIMVKRSALRNFVLENDATFKGVSFEKTYLSSIQFGRNCSVMYLMIKRSKLSHLPNSIHELKELNRLTISDSLIQAINLNVISELPNVVMLDLTKNRIRSLYSTVENVLMPALTDVHLWDNRLRNINMNLFNGMKSLERIDLSHNLISVVSGSLMSSSLQFLELSFNRIFQLDVCNWNIPNLHYLVLNDNFLRLLPKCMGQVIVNVSSLDFDNNQLQPDEMRVLDKFKNLKFLTLVNNKLPYFVFNKSTIPMGMKTLNLRNNRLKHLEIPYVPNNDMYVDVSFNCIASLDWEKVSTNLTKLVMAGNPWDCSFDNTSSFNVRENSSCKANTSNICKESGS